MSNLASSIDSATFSALNICHTSDGYQASLQIDGGTSWRVRVEETPSAAIAAVLAIGAAMVPPCPVPLIPPPPC